jgi:dTDP-4-dehydrorhamnose 3,5-epimerase
VEIRELSVPDAYEITPKQLGDDRGVFFEWYRFDKLTESLGHSLDLRQANSSVSKKGVVRGIHFADVPHGQAKYATVANGAVLDFIIDIRVGSPAFGTWDSVLLDTVDRKAVYLAEGLGHCFVALTEGAMVSYLVSDVYNPIAEHAVNPLDPEVGLVFPPEAGELLLSPKDTGAPGLSEAAAAGILPQYADVQAFYEGLRR